LFVSDSGSGGFMWRVSGGILCFALLTSVGHAQERRNVEPILQGEIHRAGDSAETWRVIVNLRSDLYPDADSRIQAIVHPGTRAAVRQDNQTVESRVIDAIDCEESVRHAYDFVPGFSADLTAAQIRSLSRRDDVEWVEPVFDFELLDTQAHALTGVDVAHELGFSGEGVVVAVIDDAIQSSHEAFGGEQGLPNSKIIAAYDAAPQNDPTACTDPDSTSLLLAHGTSVAGIVAGNGGGILGAAPDASLVFVKVADCEGEENTIDNLIEALDWIVELAETVPVDVINISLGWGSFPGDCDGAMPAFDNLVQTLDEMGTIVVAASGNGGSCDTIVFPACHSRVISAGAVYDSYVGVKTGCLMPFDLSEFGFGVDPNSCAGANTDLCPSGLLCSEKSSEGMGTCFTDTSPSFDLYAPGPCAKTSKPGGTAWCFSGTSAAAPYISGSAAVILDAYGGPLNSDEMRFLLKTWGTPTTDNKTGNEYPLVDVATTLEVLEYYKKGDLNADGTINVADTQCAILTSLAAISGDQPPTCLAVPDRADMDCSGDVTVVDVVQVIDKVQKCPSGVCTSGLGSGLDANADGIPDNCLY
jgi:subtilisin family serine protease